MADNSPKSRQYQLKPRKRLRWLVVLGMLSIIPLAHLGWWRYEKWRFDVAVEAVHAGGEPVLLEDFKHPPHIDPENPVPWWRASYKALDETYLADEVDLPLTSREAIRLHEEVVRNAEALSLVSVAARKKGEVEWDVQITSPVMNTRVRDIDHGLHVAWLLYAAAFDAHQHQDDVRAVALIRAMLCLERAMYRFPATSGYFGAISVGALAASTTRKILPDLQIAVGADATEHAARLEDVGNLLAELLDDGPLETDRLRALQFSRMQFSNDNFHIFDDADDRMVRAIGPYASSPGVYSAACDLFAAASERMNRPVAADWPAFQAAMPARPDQNLEGMFATRCYFITNWERFWQQGFDLQTEKRLCAVALAVRIYRLRTGQLPQTLADLIPSDLPEIPRDPLARNSLLRYRRSNPPVVYSVGEDAVDDGGSEQLRDPDDDPGNPWAQKDLVLHLIRPPRTSPEQWWALSPEERAALGVGYPGFRIRASHGR